MRIQTAAAVITALLVGAAGCSSGGSGHASVSAAENGYGSGATVMIHAALKTATPQQAGVDLSQMMITKPGAVFTNWTPADGVTVGVKDPKYVPQLESFLHDQSIVATVTEGPAPTAPPTGTGKS